MRPRNYRVKRDENQAAICRELKKIPNLTWWEIGEPCDLLLVHTQGKHLVLVEVKNPNADNPTMRQSQLAAMRASPRNVVVAWSLEDVLRAAGISTLPIQTLSV